MGSVYQLHWMSSSSNCSNASVTRSPGSHAMNRNTNVRTAITAFVMISIIFEFSSIFKMIIKQVSEIKNQKIVKNFSTNWNCSVKKMLQTPSTAHMKKAKMENRWISLKSRTSLKCILHNLSFRFDYFMIENTFLTLLHPYNFVQYYKSDTLIPLRQMCWYRFCKQPILALNPRSWRRKASSMQKSKWNTVCQPKWSQYRPMFG